MRRIVVPVLALAALAPPLAACHERGQAGGSGGGFSGASASRDFPASGYDRVALIGPDDVTVRIGAPSVHAVGDARVLDHLTVAVVDGELRIGRRKDTVMELGGRNTARVTVTLPVLRGVALTGSGDLQAQGAAAPAFAAELTGSGAITLSGLKARQLDVSASGSGDVKVDGSVESAKLATSGTGSIDARRLEATTVDASSGGTGDVHATAHGSATLVSSGTGDVKVEGTRRCVVRQTGTGDAECSG